MKTEQQIRNCLAIVEGNQPIIDQSARDALNTFGDGMDLEAAEARANDNQVKAKTLRWVLAEV